MAKQYCIREYGTILNRKDFPHEKDCFDQIFIEPKAFENLKNFIAENIDTDIEVDNAFSVHRKKAKDFIKVKNYVGVIETSNQTTIEILPKIYSSSSKDEIVQSRQTFLKMLRLLKNSPFKNIDNALLKSTKFPLLEIFILSFLDELDTLIKFGLRKNYINKNKNDYYLKGSLDFSKQVIHNLLHKERFYINFDEFCDDIPQNRIIKSTLVFLLAKTNISKSKIRIKNLLLFLEDVNMSKNIEKDLLLSKNLNRIFQNYTKVLSWSRIFLKGESFTNFKGKSLNKAILFPMERIFEDYIGAGFKKYYKDAEIYLQHKKNSLVDNHSGISKFRLRPDIVVLDNTNKRTTILDAKWKIINQFNKKKNYNISQSDMYQLFAYGKKYAIKEKNEMKLILLYPMHENFNKKLPIFEYDNDIKLEVIPVKLDCSLEESINLIFRK